MLRCHKTAADVSELFEETKVNEKETSGMLQDEAAFGKLSQDESESCAFGASRKPRLKEIQIAAFAVAVGGDDDTETVASSAFGTLAHAQEACGRLSTSRGKLATGRNGSCRNHAQSPSRGRHRHLFFSSRVAPFLLLGFLGWPTALVNPGIPGNFRSRTSR